MWGTQAFRNREFRGPETPAVPPAIYSKIAGLLFYLSKNFRRVIRIPNMCLVLKLDNGKVVSMANGQTDRRTESPSHPIAYYNIDYIS